jgi:hypothetical protein
MRSSLAESFRMRNREALARRPGRKRAEVLSRIEDKANFEGLQQFLMTAYALTKERRLLRRLYLVSRPCEAQRRQCW